MGYCIWQISSKFFMPRENFKHAWEAGKRVLKDVSSNGKSVEQKLTDMFLEVDFLPKFDEEGNIEDLVFEGSKHLTRMKSFFEAIGKYVEKDSFIEFQAESCEKFKWVFDGDHMEEKIGRTVYE